jgi:LPS O-antigen subunit length determinant protein (WzzB/FepE family)
MKKKNFYTLDNDIDFIYLIQLFWKEKILILLISIIFGVSGYLYSSAQLKEFKTEIKIYNPHEELFLNYQIFKHVISEKYVNKNYESIEKKFVNIFQQNFMSLGNVAVFLEQSKEFDNLKAILKSKNINPQQYFNNKLGLIKEKEINSTKYFLLFNNEIDGIMFLNNYVDYINKKTIFEISELLKLQLLGVKYRIEQEYKKAKIANIETPIINTDSQNLIDGFSYSQGSRILLLELNDINMKLARLEKDPVNYNPVLDKASIVNNISKRSYIYYPGGFFFGIFFYFVFFFFKTALQKR